MTYDRTSGTRIHQGDQNRYLIFPLEPLGMCLDGSQQLAKAYESVGYGKFYLFDRFT